MLTDSTSIHATADISPMNIIGKTEFSYASLVADIVSEVKALDNERKKDTKMKKKKSKERQGHSHATTCTDPSLIVQIYLMRSSMLTDSTDPYPGDKIIGMPPSPNPEMDTYYGVAFNAKRLSVDVEEKSHYDKVQDDEHRKDKKKKKKSKESKRSSPKQQSSRGPIEPSEYLKKRNSDDHRKHRERKKQEELKKPELRREHKRERRERRRSSSSHCHRDRSSKLRKDEHLHGNPSPSEPHHFPDMHIEQPKGATSLAQVQRAPHKRQEMNVPRSIEVAMKSSPLLETEAALHPLIMVLDQDFQKPFDVLARGISNDNFEELFNKFSEHSSAPSPSGDTVARNCIFDDNFEEPFNDFFDHYLALSPWGENDSKDGEEDFIQLSLTPVS